LIWVLLNRFESGGLTLLEGDARLLYLVEWATVLKVTIVLLGSILGEVIYALDPKKSTSAFQSIDSGIY
jgi:hypothetical protein